VQSPEGFTQKRVGEEIAKANQQADTNRRIAAEREARKRARMENESLNESLNETGHEPSDDSCTKRQPSQTPDSRLELEAKAPAPPAVDFRADLFRRWKALPDGGGGAFLSKLFRDHQSEQRVIEAVERTLDEPRGDPKAFVVGCLKAEVKAADAYDDLMRSVR
jgi:hypothetical protein